MTVKILLAGTVWTDWRFHSLATLLRVQVPDAVGRMAFVWHACKVAESDVMPRKAVDAHLGAGGADAVVESDLGQEVDGGIRIRGVADELAAAAAWRESKAAGGLARAQLAQAEGRAAGRFVKRKIHHETSAIGQSCPERESSAENVSKPAHNSPAYGPACDQQSPAYDQQSPASHQGLSLSLSLSQNQISEKPSPPRAIPGMADSVAAVARRGLGDAIWDSHQAIRAEVGRAVGIECWPLPTTDQGRSMLADRILEAADQGLDVVEKRCRHVLERVRRECIRDRSTRWLDGRIWEKARFDLAASLPLDEPTGGKSPRLNGRKRDGPSALSSLLADIAAAEARGEK
jgi:hypothetical protein